MPTGDEISLGELSRNLGRVVDQLAEVVRELHDLPEKFIPRGEYEIQVGGVKVDIGRIDRHLERHDREIPGVVTGAAASLAVVERELNDRIDKNEERRIAGTRWAIGLAATALVAFIGMGVTIALALPRLLS